MRSGQSVAVKVMEQIADNIEEIEEEYLVLRDLCLHPNIPAFHGLYLKKHPTKREEDQLWFVMEVSLTISSFLSWTQLNWNDSNRFFEKIKNKIAVQWRFRHRLGSRTEALQSQADWRANCLHSSWNHRSILQLINSDIVLKKKIVAKFKSYLRWAL